MGNCVAHAVLNNPSITSVEPNDYIAKLHVSPYYKILYNVTREDLKCQYSLRRYNNKQIQSAYGPPKAQ